jgi:hypothetical protein
VVPCALTRAAGATLQQRAGWLWGGVSRKVNHSRSMFARVWTALVPFGRGNDGRIKAAPQLCLRPGPFSQGGNIISVVLCVWRKYCYIWFTIMTRRINEGRVLISLVCAGLPAIKQIAVDASRRILYTLTDDSSIEVCFGPLPCAFCTILLSTVVCFHAVFVTGINRRCCLYVRVIFLQRCTCILGMI